VHKTEAVEGLPSRTGCSRAIDSSRLGPNEGKLA